VAMVMTEEKKTRNRMVICAFTGEEVSRRKSVDRPDLGGRVKKTALVKCPVCAKMVLLIETILTAIGRMCPHHEGVKEQEIVFTETECEPDASNL